MAKALIINGKIYYKYGWSPNYQGILDIKRKYPRALYYFQKVYNPKTRKTSYEIYLKKR